MTTPFATKPTRPADLVIAAYVHLRGVDRAELLDGKSTTREISQMRHELMYLLRDLTYLSHNEIGRIFGGRSEATVSEGIGRISDRLDDVVNFRLAFKDLRDAILARPEMAAPSTALVLAPPAHKAWPAEWETPLTVAARIQSQASAYAPDIQTLALGIISAFAILKSPNLTDDECRRAILSTLGEGPVAA